MLWKNGIRNKSRLCTSCCMQTKLCSNESEKQEIAGNKNFMEF